MLLHNLFFQKPIACAPGVPTVLIRSYAARGLIRTFTLTAEGVQGTIEIRRSYFPLFIFASRQSLPFTSGMSVQRGFFDASFDVVMNATSPCEVQVT